MVGLGVRQEQNENTRLDLFAPLLGERDDVRSDVSVSPNRSRGLAVLGRYRQPHVANDGKAPPTWSEVVVRQRRNELRKLARYRYGRNLQHASLAIGPSIGWIVVLCNLCTCLNRPVDFASVDGMAVAIGYREKIDAVVVDAIARDVKLAAKEWWNYELLSPDAVGHLLEVTSVEREEAGLRRIGSVDETSKERRERLRGDRRRKPKAIQKPWEVEGISRATWYRRNR